MLCADSETRRFSRAGSRFKGILSLVSQRNILLHFHSSTLTSETGKNAHACVRALRAPFALNHLGGGNGESVYGLSHLGR